mmetsp:Transcript_10232/g.25711  ORF Transcript_10232/g.25711 Transcript_10232/m.25711 type:complete len:297 (-) Transcript_10232:1921-2811(-)
MLGRRPKRECSIALSGRAYLLKRSRISSRSAGDESTVDLRRSARILLNCFFQSTAPSMRGSSVVSRLDGSRTLKMLRRILRTFALIDLRRRICGATAASESRCSCLSRRSPVAMRSAAEMRSRLGVGSRSERCMIKSVDREDKRSPSMETRSRANLVEAPRRIRAGELPREPDRERERERERSRERNEDEEEARSEALSDSSLLSCAAAEMGEGPWRERPRGVASPATFCEERTRRRRERSLERPCGRSRWLASESSRTSPSSEVVSPKRMVRLGSSSLGFFLRRWKRRSRLRWVS